jgi:hypothetical protein
MLCRQHELDPSQFMKASVGKVKKHFEADTAAMSMLNGNGLTTAGEPFVLVKEVTAKRDQERMAKKPRKKKGDADPAGLPPTPEVPNA